MEAFLKEEVDFADMPPDIRGWKQNSKIQVQGHKAIKTITRTCRLRDGSEKVLTLVIDRDFILWLSAPSDLEDIAAAPAKNSALNSKQRKLTAELRSIVISFEHLIKHLILSRIKSANT